MYVTPFNVASIGKIMFGYKVRLQYYNDDRFYIYTRTCKRVGINLKPRSPYNELSMT